MNVIAIIEAKEGQEANLKALFAPLVEQTRKEEGNVRYDLWVSDENPREFRMIEEWKDEASLDVHMQLPHFTEFVKAAGSLFSKDIEIIKNSTVL